jgi:hypothetical protein
MTGKEAIKILRAIASGEHYSHYTEETHGKAVVYTVDGYAKYYDAEDQHSNADDVLCELLKSIGYDDVVKAWQDVPKWYA